MRTDKLSTKLRRYKLNLAVLPFSVLLFVSCFTKIGLLHSFADSLTEEVPENAWIVFSGPLHWAHDFVLPFQVQLGIMVILFEAFIAILLPLGWLKKGVLIITFCFFLVICYVECFGGVLFGPATDSGAGTFILCYLILYWVIDPPAVFVWRKKAKALE